MLFWSMLILWYKNVSRKTYRTLLLTEKIVRNYSGFYQGLSDYYMVFINYIVLLKLTKKIILLQYLSECGVKTRSSKAKILV